MKTFLKKIFTITLAAVLLCITSIKAQTSNPRLKIKDYKLKHDVLLRMKQKQSASNSAQSLGIKINPYWQDVNAPHVVNNSHVRQVMLPTWNAIWASMDYDTAAYTANSFMRSADFGKTWRLDSVDTPNGYGLSCIAPIDANTCYAAMYDAFNYGGAIFKTTDGGDTWKELKPGKLFSATSFPDIVYFFDAQHGVAIGDDDLTDTSRLEIYTTIDAGKTWQRISDKNIPTTQGYAFSSNFNSFTVFQNRIWVVAGDTNGNNYIYRSDDFGNHWQQFPLTATFYDFAFADKQNGLGVSPDFGVGPHEVETHDGGKTWADKSFTGYPMGLFITTIPFTHTYVSTIPYGATPVSGSSYSNDGGATWKLIDTSSDFIPFGAFAFLNPFVGWCGRGDSPDPDGGMYKWKYHFSLDNNVITANDANASSDNATAATKNNTPTLSDYPNPVSNSATISFSLSQTQKVSVQIFDMNGRLIKTLADTQMQQGLHQLTWNTRSENVIAGTYLLKLQAGNNTETKKISVVH